MHLPMYTTNYRQSDYIASWLAAGDCNGDVKCDLWGVNPESKKLMKVESG